MKNLNENHRHLKKGTALDYSLPQFVSLEIFSKKTGCQIS